MDKYGQSMDKYGQSMDKVWTSMDKVWTSMDKVWTKVWTKYGQSKDIPKNVKIVFITFLLVVGDCWTSFKSALRFV